VTAAASADPLEAPLTALDERLRSGRYTAPPVKRTWLDKEDGRQRPLGRPALADPIVQRAVTMWLGASAEQDVHDFAPGLREGHSPHQALQEWREQCMDLTIGWRGDAAVRGCCARVAHGLLQDGMRKRVNDGGLWRRLGQGRHAGGREGAQVTSPEKGTPQGGVISPMLATIFLHEVLDEWYERDVNPRMKGRPWRIRLADAGVIGCERGGDARRIMAVLPKRFARVGRTLHPTKTVLVSFRKPDARQEADTGPGTCELLGFTHDWARSRRGYWVIKRNTSGQRLRRAPKALWPWCRSYRHTSLPEQYRPWCPKLRGHYQSDGIRGNYRRLDTLCKYAAKAWR
jgi:RNA-directed DNA polymerase